METKRASPRPNARSKRAETQVADEQTYEAAYKLRVALREFLAASDEAARKHRLTTERYHLLLYVHVTNAHGKHATVNDLAAALKLAPSSATQLVRRAENLRLVRRELADHDARIRHLRLTDEGERRLANTLVELGEERARLITLIAAD